MLPDPSLTPGGGDVTVIALIWISLTAILGLVTKLGDVLIRWVARRLRVPDDRDERYDELLRRLDELERERRDD